MVSLVESENIGLVARNELLLEAAQNPASLLGWQVGIAEDCLSDTLVLCKMLNIYENTKDW